MYGLLIGNVYLSVVMSTLLHSTSHTKNLNIHSFIQAISIAPVQVHYSEALPTQHGHCALCRNFTPSEGLARGPYVAARAGVEPMTLRTRGVDSTNAPLTPQMVAEGMPSSLQT